MEVGVHVGGFDVCGSVSSELPPTGGKIALGLIGSHLLHSLQPSFELARKCDFQLGGGAREIWPLSYHMTIQYTFFRIPQ